MAAVLADAIYSRVGFSPCLAGSARCVMVPGGSMFHLEPGTIHVKFENYLVILFSAHPFHSHPFSLFMVSACPLHGVKTSNSCHVFVRYSHKTSGNFVPLIRLPTL